MKLYHISQTEADDYDTYSDLVVCAESEEDAKTIHPSYGDDPWNQQPFPDRTWCKSPDQVTAEYIGEAAPNLTRGVICASFHAG